MVECVVEHPDDLARFIADDAPLLLVVQRGDCEAAFVVRVVLEVNMAKMRILGVDRIRADVVARCILVVFGGETPPFLRHVPVNRSVRNELFQALQLPYNEGAVGPRACVGNVEMVAVLLCRELCVWPVLDPVAED